MSMKDSVKTAPFIADVIGVMSKYYHMITFVEMQTKGYHLALVK